MSLDDSYTKILLHMNGKEGATDFIDESGKLWTAAGTAKITETQYKFGHGSGFFGRDVNSNATYGEIYTNPSSDFTLGSNDFTIDFWLKFSTPPSANSSKLKTIFEHNSYNASQPIMYLQAVSTTGTSGYWYFVYQDKQSAQHAFYVKCNVTNFDTNYFHHVALVRSGTTMLFFLDGVSLTSTVTIVPANSGIVNVPYMPYIFQIGLYSDIWIDEFRFSNGVARWVANFTPPTHEYGYARINLNPGFNYFLQQEVPALTLCNPNKDEIYPLPFANAIKNTLRYNAISELTFSYPQLSQFYYGMGIVPEYDHIQGKKLILIEGIGYYIIDNVEESFDGATPIKVVTALSLEAEMLSRRITGFTGTYSLTDLLQHLLDMIPSWGIGSIDASLLTLYRTFTPNNNTIYNFITSDMEKAYGCVFEFNSFDKTVSAVSNTIPSADTDIYLSFDNLVKKITFKEITQEICTGLFCYGGGDLDIHYTNPLGTNEIFNFDYYKTTDWMTQGLIDALGYDGSDPLFPASGWEGLVAAQQPIYTGLLTDLETFNNQMVAKEGALTDANSALASLEETRSAILAEVPPGDTTAVDAQIVTQNATIESMKSDIYSLQDNINQTESSLRKIVHGLYFTSWISFKNFYDDTVNIISSLQNLVVNWQLEYNDATVNPAVLASHIPDVNADLATAITDANDLETYLNTLVENTVDFPLSSAKLVTLAGKISTTITILNDLLGDFQAMLMATASTTAVSYIITELTSYLDIIHYPDNMTYAQYLELTEYIYENTYTNNNIIVTDIMTPTEIQSQSQILYDQSVAILDKVSKPRYEFSGDFANFVDLENFEYFTDELYLGGVIYIKKTEGDIIEGVLLEMSLTYDNPADFSMIFSNSYRLDNQRYIYGDVLGAAAQFGSSAATSASTATPLTY